MMHIEAGELMAKRSPTSINFYPEVASRMSHVFGIYGNKTNVINAAALMFASAPREEKDRFMALIGNLKAGLPLPEVEEESLEDAIRRLQTVQKTRRR